MRPALVTDDIIHITWPELLQWFWMCPSLRLYGLLLNGSEVGRTTLEKGTFKPSNGKWMTFIYLLY